MAIDRRQRVGLAQLEEILIAHGQELRLVDQVEPGNVEVLAVAKG